MADIFREIDEDLRQDRLNRLWQRYSNLIYGAALLIVAGTSAVVFWQNHEASRIETLGLKYDAALALRANDPAKAALAFETLTGNPSSDFGLLARIKAAELKAQAADPNAGLAALRAISTDSGVDQPYRDVAALLSVFYGLDQLPLADAKTRLLPLLAPSSPLRFSALEVTALAEIKAGDVPAALLSYQKLADDPGAPQSMRARAAEIINALKH